MLQPQQPPSTHKSKKNYSRKDLIQWLAKEALSQQKIISISFKQESLKNGVFFLVILQKVFPQDVNFIKSRMKYKPVTEYDFQKNMLLVKKVLDKYKVQHSLDVSEIVKNKGCFDFLNWIKNLSDGLISRTGAEQDSQSKQSSDKQVSPDKKYPALHSGYKTNREDSSSKNGQKTHSQTKSSRNYSASRTQNPFYKIKSGKNLVQIGPKQLPILQNNRSHVAAQQQQRQNSKPKKSVYMSEWDSLDDCNQTLYQLALEENIQSFKGMLRKVKEKMGEVNDEERFEQFLDKVYAVMFGKN